MRRYPAYADAKSPWLERLPEHWSVARLGHVATAWTSNVDKHTVAGEPPVRLCNYTDVYRNAAITPGMEFMAASATLDQIERFRIARGDTLITKDSETADDIGIPAYVEHEAPDLICGYHLAIVRPAPDAIDPRFLYWVMASAPTLRQWSVLAAGVTRVGIRSGDLPKAQLPLPPVQEQRAIADFLDRETAQIDTLIAKQEQLIERLRERRRAVSEAAVADVASTGTRLKHFVRSVAQGWSPQCLGWPADGIETWAVLKAGAANGGVFRSSENKELPPEEEPRPDITVKAGQLIVSRANTRELVGSAAVPELDYPRLMLCDKLYAFDIDPDRAESRFVALVLGSRRWRDLIEMEATGASQSMVNVSQSDIVNLQMSLPALDDQRAILSRHTAETARIDAVTSKAEQFIALAKERRSALITAAVTGQIDVRAA